MSTPADDFRTVAAGLTARVEGTSPDAWEQPSPCEGWVARDVVRHLAEWMPGFCTGAGLPFDEPPSVDDDPVACWASLRDQFQALLDDPERAEAEIQSPMGAMTLGTAARRFVIGDVLVHTWDLARATGQDETLDAEAAQRMYDGLKPMAPMLSQSGMFGPAVDCPADAPIQQRLLSLTGRAV